MSDTEKQKFPRPFIYAVAITCLAIAAGFTKLLDFDIWWHIKTGWVIGKWHFIPTFDIFSYTAPGAPWTNHEWLFQVIAAAAFYNLGLWPFTAFQFAMALLIFWIAFKTTDLLTSSKSTALWAVVIITLATADRIMARPYLVSLFLTAAFCLALHSYRLGRVKHLWYLPLAVIPWVNLHAGAIMAPAIIGAFALGETIQRIFFPGRPSDSTGTIDRRKIEHLWIVAIAATGACLINPYGVDSIVFPFLHVEMDTILTFTQEWLPAFDSRLDPVVSQIVFKVILVATPISFILGRKSALASHLMLCALAAGLTLKGKRFTPDFVVMALPIVFFNLKAIAVRIPLTHGAKALRSWANAITVCLLAALFLHIGIPATLRGGVAAEPGLGTTSRFAPVRLVEFLDKHEIGGRVFNDMGIGGFLILTRWPKASVFIDGRTPVFGDAFFKKYLTSIWNARSFDQLDDEFDFNYLVFKADQIWELRHFHQFLWQSPRWALVYAGGDGFVYLKRNDRNTIKINRLSVKINPIIEEMKKVGEIL